MAPLTRMRADNPAHAPTELHALYYAQRASAGLIVGECTAISPAAYGWADTPGLWSAEQVRAGAASPTRSTGGAAVSSRSSGTPARCRTRTSSTVRCRCLPPTSIRSSKA